MRYIRKMPEPRALAQHRSAGGTWDNFSLDKGKKEVKEQLLKEQHHLCAYCTSVIRFDKMKVEHWQPQKHFPKKELDYSNMLAVCMGCFSRKEKNTLHCDSSKQDTIIDLNPQNQDHINCIFYELPSGCIKSSNATHQYELDEVLNLNIAPLRNDRKRILSAFIKYIRKKYKNRGANWQSELKKWKNKNEPNAMIIVKYLEKKVRQNR